MCRHIKLYLSGETNYIPLHYHFIFISIYMAKGKKTGGRVAGTPNKTSVIVREAIAKILDSYFNSDTFEADLAELEAKDRVMAMEKFASYVAPKLQATSLEMTINKRTIEDKLIELSISDEDD